MGLTPALRRYFRMFVLATAIAALGPGATATSQDEGITTSHGYAAFGDLKYGSDFTHFDYVNPDAPKGGSYRFGELGTFDSLNQISLLGTFPTSLNFLADSLMRQSRDEPASFYCLICRTVSWPKDLSWVEFALDPRARFDDGSPITVEDVKFSAGLGEGLSIPAFSRIKQIVDRVEQTGPNSVRLYFNMQDNPTPITVVALMPILPKHFYKNRDPFRPRLDRPVQSGAYKVGEVSPGRFIEWKRDPDYWASNHPVNKGRFNFDTVRIRYFRDAQMQKEAFRAGLIDLRMDRSATDLREEERLPAVRRGEIKRLEIPYHNGAFYNSVTFNTRRAFLSDPRVRKALLLAYDYEWVQEKVLGGEFGRVESNFANSDFEAIGLPTPGELDILDTYRDSLPPELFTREPWSPKGGSRANMRRNLLEARDILREAGYKVVDGRLRDPRTGAPVVLELLAYSPLLASHMSLFIANMDKLGIEVSFRSVDAAQMRHMLRNYDYDLLYNRTVFAPVTTPGVGMALMWTSQSADMPNLLNYAGVKDPVIDDAIARMIAATDRRQAVDALRVVDRVARWKYYSVPLMHAYPTPVGVLPLSYWDKFGRPAREQTYNFPFYALDNWWYEPARAARLGSKAQG